MTREALLDEILRLEPEERIELLEAAWDIVSFDQESRSGPEGYRQLPSHRPHEPLHVVGVPHRLPVPEEDDPPLPVHDPGRR